MALFAQSHPSFPYQVVNQFRQNQVLGQLGQQFALRGKNREMLFNFFGRSRLELGTCPDLSLELRKRDALY